MLRPLFDRLMPKGLLSSHDTTSTGTVGPGRFTRNQESRKAYGQLQDYQIELVPPTGEGSTALISAAANVAPHSEIDDELGIGTASDGGRERYTHDDDLDTGIHVQRSITIER